MCSKSGAVQSPGVAVMAPASSIGGRPAASATIPEHGGSPPSAGPCCAKTSRVAGDLLDRLTLDEMPASILIDRLHDEHPPTCFRAKQPDSNPGFRGVDSRAPTPRLSGSNLHAETHFKDATPRLFRGLDRFIRRRLRAVLRKQEKRPQRSRPPALGLDQRLLRGSRAFHPAGHLRNRETSPMRQPRPESRAGEPHGWFRRAGEGNLPDPYRGVSPGEAG